MSNFLKKFVGVVLVVGLSGNLYAESKVANCQISFKTRGSPVLVSIEGKSEAPCTGSWVVEGGDTKKSKVTMDLQKLDTGIPLRNKHLRENYLHTDKFPTATMTDIEARDIDGQIKGTVKGKSPFKGMLELHGKKKQVTGNYEVKGGNLYSGDMEIDLPDFEVERPSFMGVKIVDKVYLTFKFKTE